MGKIIKIYCEGKAGSADYEVISKVIQGLPNILIEPIGSKLGGGSIIQFYEETITRSDYKIFFRDRDFDRPVPAQPALIKVNSYTYYSYRTTIENYLFDVNLFHQFIQDPKAKNKHSILKSERYSSLTEGAIKAIFIEAAKNIRYYQAVRHTMGQMRMPTDFGTTWIKGSGKLPEDLSKDYCREQALTKIGKAKEKTKDWTIDQFDKNLAVFLDRFNTDFFDNLEFLVWYQGKNFASALLQLLPSFPIKPYYKFARKTFDYKQFEDLIQLRQLIEQNF